MLVRHRQKYKKCHRALDDSQGWQTQPEESVDFPGMHEFDGLRKRIGAFMGAALPQRDIKRAIKEPLGEQVTGEDDAMLLTDWIMHDHVAPSLRRTVLEEFLARESPRLTDRERGMTEGWSRSFMSLCEVQGLKPGTRLTVRDLILGEEAFVHDVRMSNSLSPWECCLPG